MTKTTNIGDEKTSIKITDITKPMCEFCKYYQTPFGKNTCMKKQCENEEEATQWSSEFGAIKTGNLDGETLFPQSCKHYTNTISRIGWNDVIYHKEEEKDWEETIIYQAVSYETCPKGWRTEGYFLTKEEAYKANEFARKYNKAMIFKHTIKYPCICFIDHIHGSININGTYDNIYVSFGECKHCGRKWKRDNAISRYAKLDTIMFQQ